MKGCLLLLAWLVVAPMASAAEPAAVDTAKTGSIVYYGLELHGPHVFGVEEGKLYLRSPEDSAFKESGYRWIPARLDSGSSKPAIRGPIDRMRDEANAVALKAKADGFIGFGPIQQKVAFLERQPQVEKVTVVNNREILIYLRGLPHPIHDIQDLDRPAPKRIMTPNESLRLRASQLARYLEQGHIIIIDDDGECIVPLKRLEGLRQGPAGLTRQTLAGLVEKDSFTPRRLRRPAASLREIVEGR